MNTANLFQAAYLIGRNPVERFFPWLVCLFLYSGGAAQDLAPAAMNDIVYVAFPTNPNAPASNLRSGMLLGDGTHVPLNISGAAAVLPQGTFLWEKRSPQVAILTVTAGLTVVRTEVTFSTSFKGTYRELTPDGRNAGPSGDMSFSVVPNDPTPPLLNVSSRIRLTAGRPAFVGFVVDGSTPRQVLMRAIGPSLVQFGVGSVSANPVLTVFKGAVQLAENAAWGGAPGLAETFTSVGAFALPATSRDCALVLTLVPGNYTVQSRDADGGEVLLEVYLIR